MRGLESLHVRPNLKTTSRSEAVQGVRIIVRFFCAYFDAFSGTMLLTSYHLYDLHFLGFWRLRGSIAYTLGLGFGV